MHDTNIVPWFPLWLTQHLPQKRATNLHRSANLGTSLQHNNMRFEHKPLDQTNILITNHALAFKSSRASAPSPPREISISRTNHPQLYDRPTLDPRAQTPRNTIPPPWSNFCPNKSIQPAEGRAESALSKMPALEPPGKFASRDPGMHYAPARRIRESLIVRARARASLSRAGLSLRTLIDSDGASGSRRRKKCRGTPRYVRMYRAPVNGADGWLVRRSGACKYCD